eukprot:13178-Heterococcus_DN1.PRE.5
MTTSDIIAIALATILLSDMEFASCRVSPTGVIHSAVSCYLTRRDHLEQGGKFMSTGVTMEY